MFKSNPITLQNPLKGAEIFEADDNTKDRQIVKQYK